MDMDLIDFALDHAELDVIVGMMGEVAAVIVGDLEDDGVLFFF